MVTKYIRGSRKIWHLTYRQRCDLELLLNRAFAPLKSYHSKADYYPILEILRMANGQLWPIPIVLDVSQAFVDTLSLTEEIALYDCFERPIAHLTVTEIWQPDKLKEAEAIYGTCDTAHPGVNTLLHETDAYHISGQNEYYSTFEEATGLLTS